MRMVVITIGGPPGVGTTTIASVVAQKFNLRYVSTGSLFREIAKERGINVEELSNSAEKEVDLEVDNRSKQEAQKGDVVLESDLAAWINKDTSDIKIWLTAPLEARAERVFNDEKARVAEKFTSLEQAKEEINKRFEEDKERYMKYYSFDLNDMSIYDLVLDTENLDSEEVINKVEQFIQGRL